MTTTYAIETRACPAGDFVTVTRIICDAGETTYHKIVELPMLAGINMFAIAVSEVRVLRKRGAFAGGK